MPCKVRDPIRKGKVESSVGHAQKAPLQGVGFEGLEESHTFWETGDCVGPIRGSVTRIGRLRPFISGAELLLIREPKEFQGFPAQPHF
jgi:hypothetical protein